MQVCTGVLQGRSLSLGSPRGFRTARGHGKILNMRRSHKGEEVQTGSLTLPEADCLRICLEWGDDFSPFFSLEANPEEKSHMDAALLSEKELDTTILKRPSLSDGGDVSEIIDWHESQWKQLSDSKCDDES